LAPLTFGHYDLPEFPEVAVLASEVRLFGSMTLLPDQFSTTGVTVVILFTNMVRLHLFVLLCYTFILLFWHDFNIFKLQHQSGT
jgi:hypothetical protein